MASRDAPPEPFRRIRHALSRWALSGYVEWDDRAHIDDWMTRYLDRTRFSRREIGRLMCQHVEAGGRVKEQDNVPGYEAEVWYAMELDLGGVRTFIKFILEPDEEDDPGILIIRVHD